MDGLFSANAAESGFGSSPAGSVSAGVGVERIGCKKFDSHAYTATGRKQKLWDWRSPLKLYTAILKGGKLR